MSAGEEEWGRGREAAAAGKLRAVGSPWRKKEAASWALAADSAEEKEPSHTRVFFPGNRISDTYRPTPAVAPPCTAAAAVPPPPLVAPPSAPA
ncbi:unnamed protein product [Spirodela intermedia]|uniref:Uncharacterized protein n=1 Tax=Spirodela intermedia TaxID=51605 RepID=A0A7I8J1U3_SPIIN|nr:unnamed protein product [Spirodela intermedia]CAA6663932.1 unnamed protein product [Spirodela intermedia]